MLLPDAASGISHRQAGMGFKFLDLPHGPRFEQDCFPATISNENLRQAWPVREQRSRTKIKAAPLARCRLV
jgi:hypothetical protein